MRPATYPAFAGVAAASPVPRPSYPLLSRVAASLWFLVLAVFLARGLVGTVRAVPHDGSTFADWSAVISHGCTMGFFLTLGWLMMVRPPAVARRGGAAPVITAFVGTYLVWLLPFLPSGHVSAGVATAAAAITLCGSLSIIFTVLHLGRSFSIAPQARKLVVAGPYRLVRHPLYLAEEIALIGILMQCAWWAALGFLAVHMALQVRRMLYEESLLRTVFPDYQAYARRTARLIPGIW